MTNNDEELDYYILKPEGIPEEMTITLKGKEDNNNNIVFEVTNSLDIDNTFFKKTTSL